MADDLKVAESSAVTVSKAMTAPRPPAFLLRQLALPALSRIHQ
jgi:hypothetical protein